MVLSDNEFFKAGCFVTRKAILKKKSVRKSSLIVLTLEKNTHEIFRHSLRDNAGYRKSRTRSS